MILLYMICRFQPSLAAAVKILVVSASQSRLVANHFSDLIGERID